MTIVDLLSPHPSGEREGVKGLMDIREERAYGESGRKPRDGRLFHANP
jgi:hypothetical protein